MRQKSIQIIGGKQINLPRKPAEWPTEQSSFIILVLGAGIFGGKNVNMGTNYSIGRGIQFGARHYGVRVWEYAERLCWLRCTSNTLAISHTRSHHSHAHMRTLTSYGHNYKQPASKHYALTHTHAHTRTAWPGVSAQFSLCLASLRREPASAATCVAMFHSWTSSDSTHTRTHTHGPHFRRRTFHILCEASVRKQK